MDASRRDGHPGDITYAGVLNIDDLLRLQRPLSSEPSSEELLFVIVHQVTELWLKQALADLDRAYGAMTGSDLPLALRLLRRATEIVRVIDRGFAVIEALPAYEYRRFRPWLRGGSGFQSAQFREFELVLGIRRDFALDQPAFTEPERRRIQNRLHGPNLWDGFVAAMRANGCSLPDRAQAAADLAARQRVRQMLRELYVSGDAPLLRDLAEAMVELDSAVAVWRHRHAVMADRQIGTKTGTGGYGVEYLYRSARLRAFPELWDLRAYL
ncbi:MAG TPA: tryptophan 2,3-dioxygenase family protein [Bacillota bacterium]